MFPLAACGGATSADVGSREPGQTSSARGSPGRNDSERRQEASSRRAVIDVIISKGSVLPNGEPVKVDAGQDVTLRVTADEAGELHVHTVPDQELVYAAGTTDLVITDLDQPGVFEVGSHELDRLILLLQVQ
jgi:hypothetical protein